MTTPKYELIRNPKNPEEEQHAIRILDGKFEGVSVLTHELSITDVDGKAILAYTVELVEDKNNISPSPEDLRDPIGSILMDIIQDYITKMENETTEETDV